MNIWTEERDAQLKKLRAEKLTAPQIAEIMRLTKGQVAGRLHRLFKPKGNLGDGGLWTEARLTETWAERKARREKERDASL